ANEQPTGDTQRPARSSRVKRHLRAVCYPFSDLTSVRTQHSSLRLLEHPKLPEPRRRNIPVALLPVSRAGGIHSGSCGRVGPSHLRPLRCPVVPSRASTAEHNQVLQIAAGFASRRLQHPTTDKYRLPPARSL